MKYSQRKLVAIFALLAILIVWIVVATTIGSVMAEAPDWLQLVFYIVAGLGWILPIRPIFLWMNSAPDVEKGP